MKKVVVFVMLTIFLSNIVFFPDVNAVLLTDPDDPRSWQGATVGTFAQLYFGSNTAANRQLVIDNDLLDDGIFDTTGATPATLVPTSWTAGGGGSSPYPGVVGGAHPAGDGRGRSLDTTGTGLYDYLIENSRTVFEVGNVIHPMWYQSSNTLGDTVYDLGGLFTKAAVFNTIDHGPLPQEAIESTVFLSNTATGPWTQAVVERVWLEGYEPNLGILWDGFVYAVGTGTDQQFRYVSIIHGGPGALVNDGDDEINGVLGLQSTFVQECPPGTTGTFPDCIPITGAVGGVIIPIDATTLLLAGPQSSLVWMAPLLGGAAGVVAIFIKKRKN